ncbi:hypothetical protein SpCBS45565_g04305 [Spizellomyces sp. 'palustris']|nr:hypothetical protein SpCBS45565_g04305 [Spizellomyces sp. 'palustris']
MRYITGDEVGLIKITSIPRSTSAPKKPRKDASTPSIPPSRALGSIDREAEIQFICFASSQQTVLVARKNGVAEYWDIEAGSVVRHHKVFEQEVDERGKIVLNKHRKGEHFVGVADVDGTLVACTDRGNLHVIPPPTGSPAFPPGTHNLKRTLLFRAQVYSSNPHLLATGGDEQDLTLWDLSTLANAPTPKWTAKNVANDYLDMRVPIWITDLAFVSDTRIITISAHAHLRLYDTIVSRRPIINITVGESPLKSLGFYVNGNSIQTIVSDTTGHLLDYTLDPHAKTAKLVGKFPVSPGAITGISASKDSVVVVGLDRFVRVYDQERKLARKVYLKQRLTGLLVDDVEEEVEGGEEEEKGEEDVWAEMDRVGEKEEKAPTKKLKRKK